MVKIETSRDAAESLYDAAIHQLRAGARDAHLFGAAVTLRLCCGMSKNVDEAVSRVHADQQSLPSSL